MSRFNKVPPFFPVPRYVRAYSTVQAPLTIRKYNDLRIHEFKGSSTGEIVHGYYDDVALLLMQKNFEKINSLEYQSFMKDFSLNASTVRSPVKPKMTDDQLIKYIKSKNCQSASEVSAWMSYLCKEFDIVKDSVVKAQSQLDDLSNSDTPPVPDPSQSPTSKDE